MILDAAFQEVNHTLNADFGTVFISGGNSPDLSGCIRMWKPNTEYKVGDYVYNDAEGYNFGSGTLLQCWQDHTSSEDFKKDLYTYWMGAWIIANRTPKDIVGNVINDTYANAIKGSASGSAIAMRDVSPIEHSVGCKVESKNMLDPRSYVDTSNQGTVSILDDGLVELDGNLDMENGGTYAEITYDFIVTEPCVLTLWFKRENYGWDANAYLNDTSLNLMGETTISVPLSVGTHKLTLLQGDQSSSGTYIQIEKGTTATSYTPYIADMSTVEVKRYNKNLLPSDVHDFSKWDNKGNNQKHFYLDNIVPGCAYTLSFEKITNLEQYGYLYLGRLYDDGQSFKEKDFTQINLLRTNWSFTAEFGCRYYLFGWFAYNTSAGMFDNNIFKALSNFQLELGNKKTPYEPYIEPTTYTANTDGTVENLTSISPSMTLISSNDGEVINCNYNVDTKAYIDKKFAELQALILEG